MSPPPINWHTKPKPNQPRPQDNFSLSSSQNSIVTTDILVPVYINPARLHDIEAALKHLGLPSLLNPGNDFDYPASPQFQRLNNSISPQPGPHLLLIPENNDHPASPQFERLDNPISPQPEDTSDCLDLSTSFSRLSTSISCIQAPLASFPVQHSPVVHPNPSPKKALKRYYIVIVGKCTGVFWDKW